MMIYNTNLQEHLSLHSCHDSMLKRMVVYKLRSKALDLKVLVAEFAKFIHNIFFIKRKPDNSTERYGRKLIIHFCVMLPLVHLNIEILHIIIISNF